MSLDTRPCTADECQTLTTLSLCTNHILELDELLQDVPTLINFLTGPIHRTSVTHKPGGGSFGGSHPGSKPPINLDALLLQAWLKQLPARAHNEAMENPQAGRTLHMAQIWVTNARTLVWGPEDPVIDHEENQARIKDAAPPMPTRDLIPWLRNNARITITGKDIRNWAARGKISPVEKKPRPTYHPHDVLQAWRDTRKDTPA